MYPGNQPVNDSGKMRYPNDTHSWKMKGNQPEGVFSVSLKQNVAVFCFEAKISKLGYIFFKAFVPDFNYFRLSLLSFA